MGEIRLGEMGLGEMGLGEMGQNRYLIAMRASVAWVLRTGATRQKAKPPAYLQQDRLVLD